MEEARPNLMHAVAVDHREVPPVHGTEAGSNPVWLARHSSDTCHNLGATSIHKPKLGQGFTVSQLGPIDKGDHD
jgi:hypothetical protein